MKRWLLLIPLLLLARPAHATSAITRVGSCSGVTSCTPPTHQAGDLFIAYGFANNTGSGVTLPAGWVSIVSQAGTGSTTSQRVACKVALSAAETVTGFTSATGLIALVYRSTVFNRPTNCASLTVGANGPQTSANNATLSYAGLTLTDAGATSWVIGCGGSVSATNVGTAPTGMTNVTTATAGAVACHDTNAVTATWTTQTVGVNASAVWQTYTLEIRACTTAACIKNVVKAESIGMTTVAATAAHGAGNKLIATVMNPTVTKHVSSIANTAGDTWALCTGSRETTTNNVEIWETTSVPVGNTSDTVTVTLTASDTFAEVSVIQASGVVTGACETAAVGNSVAATSITSASFSPAAAGNLNIAYVGNTGAAVTYSAGTGYLLNVDYTAQGLGTEQRIDAPAGAQTASFTSTATTAGMSVASFKAGLIGGAVGGALIGPVGF